MLSLRIHLRTRLFTHVNYIHTIVLHRRNSYLPVVLQNLESQVK